ncbi:hypothetical protein TraAM80_06042 [Trypanosoma rangeli]|uniref:Uncharacterized protein n=1 Tax=Trypanosoma rangeli TaxID=5698 RepID=A0A3R7LTG0_TRYRA|nr:uncharacterized protein TraAM80_06042 [Trypanosoma rangeli]RNF02992.1 hypothetical protein TraAM80_06042 [Trypanosoma rangeli]|eukprot:RNF02992.1 hypothetical protein TraAM80_06042 [Trypanosoma rangeli]
MSTVDADANSSPDDAGYAVSPVEENANECQEGKQEEEALPPRGGGLTFDEKRAGLIVLGCFLFQEADSSAFRTMLVASVAAYAVSKLFVTSFVTLSSSKAE